MAGGSMAAGSTKIGDPPPAVARVFGGYPPKARAKLLRLRRVLMDTASGIEAVGPITETLKWGEPAYLTQRTGSGSTVRLAWKAATPDHLYVFFNCQTTLVDTFRTLFPELEYEGDRAIVLSAKQTLPMAELRECFAAALTYHKRKALQRRKR
jgi:hypothetical protein